MNVRVVVVGGPNRGATYFLDEGENTLGRAPENQVVLASTQVSKKHCSIVCNGGKAELRDLGSSNGTFVNGVLAKKKLLQSRDKISVGPFVLEVLLPTPSVSMVVPGVSTSSAVPGLGGDAYSSDSVVPPVNIDPSHFKLEAEEPKSLVGKYKKKFDDVFLPVVYDFYERTDYVTMLIVVFAIYTILALGFTVYPVLQRSREEVLRQAESQALYISQILSDLNRQAILEKREGSLTTAFADSEVNVKEAIVANLEGRIMAPGSRLNEAYNNPNFLKYKDLLQKRQNLWGKPRIIRRVEEEEVIAFTPIMVMSPTKGINVPGAIATVVYSTSSLALDTGTISAVYLEALFWSGALGVVFLYILYAFTHKPLEKLADDMDKVLKGEADSVEKKYRNDIIDKVIDSVNSALSRISRKTDGGSEDISSGDTEGLIISNLMNAIEYTISKVSHSTLLLDPELRVRSANPPFEELTGIRGALGEVIDSVSRDESFPSLIREMVEKSAMAGNEGVQEDYDFPSGFHKITCIALSGVPGRPEAYLFIFEKQGD
ncbi:MAG: FHA domain-containing protein [Oligoflexia bacterium]|nr:FHA domain-containing protein [Oligoflexia bacterium]